MDAIDFLTQQHREVDELFNEIQAADVGAKYGLFETLADMLAVHAEIEEQIFYPSVKSEQTIDVLKDSVNEHLEQKRILADLLDSEPEDNTFDTKIKQLMASVQHHVKDEETKLFPRVRQFFDDRKLQQLYTSMRELANELEREGEPSENIPLETERPAPI